jgi:hypothetical protein
MKQTCPAAKVRYYSSLFLITAFMAVYNNIADAQSCPLNSNKSLTSYPNTYYPANQSVVNAGSFSIALGPVTYGTTAISAGDALLVIQMQGAQINSTNTSSYGDGTGTGSGYLNNGAMAAGKMEFVLAANSVPLTGGTLNVVSALSNSYQNTPFGTDGQYTYQVIRVPLYYDVTLYGNIVAPRWDGASGGVIVLYATNNINLSGFSIDASGLGFRGGGGRSFNGAGSGSNADFITPATSNANGGKGEGIAGTPKYLNNNNSFLDVSSFEGYPNGSYGKGAPATAGGGGTDGNPANNNDENTGGGGGANGGAGGMGGNSWNSNLPTGGRGGNAFAQASPSRLVMGGGGGAGTTNNGTPNGNGFYSSGTAGGGIIILSANAIVGPGNIRANGANGFISVKNDGSGGGGAGGSILIYSKTGSLSNVIASAKGGSGGSNQLSITTTNAEHGPGGGGGGGVIYSNMTLSASSAVDGGVAGKTKNNTTNYGATAGSTGILTQTMTAGQMPAFPISCVTLPVEFHDIAAVRNDGANTITWQVVRETNTLEYIVERSTDGSSFTEIGHVPYQVRTTSANEYSFKDNDVTTTGTVYYRVRVMEVSGNSQYSKIVSLLMDGLASKLTVFPNPAKTSATVSFVAISSGDVSLRLFDLKGSQIWQKQLKVSAGSNSFVLDQLGTIPNGLYLLQWFDGLKPQQVKLIVNH